MTTQTVSPTPVKVDVWSDIACPFCYIGKRKFEEAAATSGIPIELEYHSYELAPDTDDVVPHSHLEHLVNRMGVSHAQAASMEKRTVGVVADAGLPIDYGRMKQSNTRRAHQLLHFAKARGIQAQLKDRLMTAYFSEGRSMASVDDLADLAAEVGLDRADVIRSLETDEFQSAVDADKRRAADYGVRGVPFFVFNEAIAVSGAQDPSVFVDALTEAAAAASGKH